MKSTSLNLNQNLVDKSSHGRTHWAYEAVKEPVVLVASSVNRIAKIALHLVAVIFSLLLTFPCFCISPYFYTTLTTSSYKVVKEILGVARDLVDFVSKEPLLIYRVFLPPPLVKQA